MSGGHNLTDLEASALFQGGAALGDGDGSVEVGGGDDDVAAEDVVAFAVIADGAGLADAIAPPICSLVSANTPSVTGSGRSPIPSNGPSRIDTFESARHRPWPGR
jgi:hypothetical protein